MFDIGVDSAAINSNTLTIPPIPTKIEFVKKEVQETNVTMKF